MDVRSIRFESVISYEASLRTLDKRAFSEANLEHPKFRRVNICHEAMRTIHGNT